MADDFRDYGFLTSDDGVLPDLATPAWIKAGAGAVSIVDTGFDINDTSGVERLVHWIEAFPDVNVEKPESMAAERMEIQSRFRGVSHTGAASPLLLWIDDGERSMGLRLGANLELVHPGTLATLRVLVEGWPWTSAKTYKLVKVGTDRWQVWVDDKQYGDVGYEEAPPAVGEPTAAGFQRVGSAGHGWGSMSVALSARGIFESIEWSTGIAVPSQWQASLTQLEFPARHLSRWTRNAEGVLRALVGVFQDAQDRMKLAWSDTMAGTYDAAGTTYEGERLPTAEPEPWVLVNGAAVSVVRERLRFTAVGTETGAKYTYSNPVFTEAPEYNVAARWILRSSTPDAWGRMGPGMRMTDGTKWAVAQLVQVVAGAHWSWVLTTSVTDGAPVVELGERWQVDPWRVHHVEVVLQAPSWCFLVVDEQIVDRIPYSSLDFV